MIPAYNFYVYPFMPFIPANCSKPPTVYSIMNMIVNGDKEDTNDNVIYLNSFSSLLCKGISASWALLPEKLYNEYTEMYKNFPCPLSYLEQAALTMFMEKRYLDNYLETIQPSLAEEEQEDELAF